jgi:hypothetical protein
MARDHRTPGHPGPRRFRNRATRAGWLAPLLLLALVGPAACDSSADAPASKQAGADTASGRDAGTANTAVPACPFTAAQVSDIVGRPMVDEGNCLFGDGKGVASLTITMASQLAGTTTYDYAHEQAGKQYGRVVDLDRGDQSYLATKDIAGEAVVISAKGTYTLIMSSFSIDPAGYEQKLRRLLDAIPS